MRGRKRVKISEFSLLLYGISLIFAMYDSYFLKSLEGKETACCINDTFAQRSLSMWFIQYLHNLNQCRESRLPQPSLSRRKLSEEHETHVCGRSILSKNFHVFETSEGWQKPTPWVRPMTPLAPSSDCRLVVPPYRSKVVLMMSASKFQEMPIISLFLITTAQ